MSALLDADRDAAEMWQGDATSVLEFLRPLRAQLDAEGGLEVCVNRPGELLVETVSGWRVAVSRPWEWTIPRWRRRSAGRAGW